MAEDIANIKVLISADRIRQRVDELAEQITRDYAGKDLLVLGILNGSVPFLADLIRSITIPLVYDFVAFTSYCGTESTGNIETVRPLKADVKGKHVLIVEDIVDTGRTLACSGCLDSLIQCGAESVGICALLDKPARRLMPVTIHYCGFTIEDKFVVGYGLDYNGFYRNLPYIGYFENIPHS